MAHGTGDTRHAAPDGAATGTPAGGTTGEARAPARVATGRFAAARGGGGGAGGGRTRETETEESEQERQARVARALRAAEGDDADDENNDTDWRAVGLFGAGVAIGTLLGAGVALLLAPASGFETRMRLIRSARRTRDRISRGARRGSRDLKRNVSRGLTRKLTRSRWAAEDAIDRRRRRLD